MLSFQRLGVYQRAIEFLALVGDIVDELPKGHSARADQLVRAAESVVRNIAQGAGRWSEADSAKHYKIARGEGDGVRSIARRHEAAETPIQRASGMTVASDFSKVSSPC